MEIKTPRQVTREFCIMVAAGGPQRVIQFLVVVKYVLLEELGISAALPHMR
jgi:hypothetical protein